MTPRTPSKISRRRVLNGLAALTALTAAALPPLAPAWADSLDELRKSGALGEGFDGYVKVRDAKAGGAKATAAKVNKKRRAIYEKRAGEQGVKADKVGTIFAKEIMKKAPKGTWFLQANGKWVRK